MSPCRTGAGNRAEEISATAIAPSGFAAQCSVRGRGKDDRRYAGWRSIAWFMHMYIKV